MNTIAETCACGATFSASSMYMSTLDNSVAKWREQHKHAESVGICGDKAQPLMIGDVEIEQAWCVLKAGHAGAHDGGDGRHWIKAAPAPSTGPRSDSGGSGLVVGPNEDGESL